MYQDLLEYKPESNPATLLFQKQEKSNLHCWAPCTAFFFFFKRKEEGFWEGYGSFS
jgi:hypothetical protein